MNREFNGKAKIVTIVNELVFGHGASIHTSYSRTQKQPLWGITFFSHYSPRPPADGLEELSVKIHYHVTQTGLMRFSYQDFASPVR